MSEPWMILGRKDKTYFRLPQAFGAAYRPWTTNSFGGWVDASLFEQLKQEAKSNPDVLFTSFDADVVRDRRNLTARIRLGDRYVWIKRFRPKHERDRLIYATKAGKCVYAWNAAMALMENGFHTPRPLIGLRKTGKSGGAEGIVAFEDIGDSTSLKELLTDGSLPHSEREQVLTGLGECLRRFHDLGFRHRDLRQGNILVNRSKDAWNFYFLDLNRLRVQKPLTDIQRLREIEKLNLSSNGLEAFFRAYMPKRNSAEWAGAYGDRVTFADRLEHLPLGRWIRKIWYYAWELRAFGRARRP